MPNLDEMELARLEALAEEYTSCISLPLTDGTYRELAAHFCPALVAEVRRLRSCKTINFADLERHLESAQAKEIEALREKVEAWEWLFEAEGLFRHFINRKSYWRVRSCAFDELAQSLTAAREAVC